MAKRRPWSSSGRRTKTDRSPAWERARPRPPPKLPSTPPSDQERAMSNVTSTTGVTAKERLRIADQGIDLDAEIAKFEEEERKRLGLDGKTEQWVEEMVNLQFTRSE